MSYLLDLDRIWVLLVGLKATWPVLLVSAVSAAVLGVAEALVLIFGRWKFLCGIIPVAAAVVWVSLFAVSGLAGNLAALFVFGPSMVLWPAAIAGGLAAGAIIADKRKARKK